MEKKGTSNYLGSAYSIKGTGQYFINLKPENIEKLEADKYSRIRVAILKFQKGSQVGYSVYLHDGVVRPNITMQILQLNKDKLLSLPRSADRNGQETIKLTSANKKPESITPDGMDVAVYVNKYRDEMKDWTKEERNDAVRPTPEDYVGGGWNSAQWKIRQSQKVMDKQQSAEQEKEPKKTKKQNI